VSDPLTVFFFLVCFSLQSAGLEQEFNFLDAQREAGEVFIASQRTEGWTCLPDRYDDGGFTGGNMDRPALRRLLTDIEACKIDCVVVYKVDRLSRSLLDFARMMETFDKARVSFASVTQQFNTATSMGRLVLNVLLSFAQLEREIISERTRDKMAATRRKGKWSGGLPVLDYDIDPQGYRLVLDEDEAVQVRAIFQLYLQHEALLPVVQEPVVPPGRVPRVARWMALALRCERLLRVSLIGEWHVDFSKSRIRNDLFRDRPDFRLLLKELTKSPQFREINEELGRASWAFRFSLNRGDKTQLELFIAGVRGWEAYPRQRMDDGKPVEHVA
jgi:DNA invertase Pin-like site-specific DNA recombinase